VIGDSFILPIIDWGARLRDTEDASFAGVFVPVTGMSVIRASGIDA